VRNLPLVADDLAFAASAPVSRRKPGGCASGNRPEPRAVACCGFLVLFSCDSRYTIRHLLEAEPTVFKSDDVAIIVQAFERVLQKKRLVDRDDPVVLMIAELTIEAARKGERDPVRLSQTVLSRMSL
jgi:hypothetical protein